MFEPSMSPHAFGQHLFAGMSERRMTQVVSQGDGLRQIFIERQRPGDGAADRRDLDGMGQARPQMIARAVQEHLGLVFKPAKRA